MDTTYPPNEFSRAMIDTLKNSMTLEFKPEVRTPTGLGLLESPDLRMIQLTSPDLENMIFQQSGLLNLQTPTANGLMRLTSIRDDNKPDLSGFDEALAKVAQQRNNVETVQQFAQPLNVSSASSQSQSQPQSVSQSLVYSCAPSRRQFEAVSGAKQTRYDDAASYTSSASYSDDDESYTQRSVPRKSPAKNTGAVGKQGTTFGVAKINMDDQDKLRVERKRERNRLAARKCRERKIKKIDELTDQVTKLEREKSQLATRIGRMQTEISRLNTILHDHSDSGCKIPIAYR